MSQIILLAMWVILLCAILFLIAEIITPILLALFILAALHSAACRVRNWWRGE
jgi:hypothetical protein